MMEVQQQIPPKLFIFRSFILFLIISLLQFFYLTTICELVFATILVWFFVFATGLLCFLLLMAKFKSYVEWPEFNVASFSILFFISFFTTLLFSRLPYLISFFEKGMYLTRLDSGLGSGGWYTYFSVFFYPLGIVLAFIGMRRRLYYMFFSFTMVIVLVDFIVLGTRGVPVFIIIFHLLMLRIKFVSIKSIFFMTSLSILLVILVDYQTQERSLNTLTVGWDWVRTIEHSWIFDNLKVKGSVVFAVDEYAQLLFPLIYLLQYLTHSLAEFSNLLSSSVYDLVGTGLYLKDEICLVSGCDRSSIQESISMINPRVGLYQTLYSSLLFDFGVLGLAILVFAVLLYFIISNTGSSFVAFGVFFSVVMAVSGVENYFYNGLGLARFFIFILLWKVISLKTPRLVH